MTIFEYVLNFGLVGLVVLHVRGIRLTKALAAAGGDDGMGGHAGAAQRPDGWE